MSSRGPPNISKTAFMAFLVLIVGDATVLLLLMLLLTVEEEGCRSSDESTRGTEGAEDTEVDEEREEKEEDDAVLGTNDEDEDVDSEIKGEYKRAELGMEDDELKSLLLLLLLLTTLWKEERVEISD